MRFKRLHRALIGAAALAACLPPANAAALRDMTPDDIAAWKRIQEEALTPAGDWLVYREGKSGGVGETAIVMRSTRDETQRRYPALAQQNGPAELQLSPSGKWAAFKGPEALQIVELSNGTARQVANVRTFHWIPGDVERLLIEHEAVAPSKAFDVTILAARTGRSETLRQFNEYALDAANRRLAWVDAQGIHVRTFASGTAKTVAPPADGYRNLTWASGGDSLAVLKPVGTGYSLLVLHGLNRGAPKTSVFDPRTWAGFPKDLSICTQPVYAGYYPVNFAPLLLRDDGRGVFFRVCGSRPKAPDLGLPPALAIWHWKDEELPQQRKIAAAGLPPHFLAFVSLDTGRFVQLSDTTMQDVVPPARGRYALGYDSLSYGWTNNAMLSHRSTQLRDYALIDIKTGKRTPVVRGLRVPVTLNGPYETLIAIPQMSPDGAFVIYQQEGDYMSYEVATGIRRNLTARLPTRFYYEANRPATQHHLKQSNSPFPVLQGWTADFRSVLLHDFYDVWLLPLDGAAARNLTVNGRHDTIAYGRTFVGRPMDWIAVPADSPVDVHQPLYFKAVDISTAREGLGVLRPGEQQVHMYRWDDATMDFRTNPSHDVRLFARQTSNEPVDYFLADKSWQTIRRLTDINPQAREVRRPPECRYLNYVSSSGEPLRAILYLPAGYEAVKRYPMVVDIYEHLSGLRHAYRDPGNEGDDVIKWQQAGYAVLWPDIVPRVGEPGPAAVEAVQAAVDAAVATGTVDRERLGLKGHSYGGYETSFVISQLQIFKAAVSYAGMSNLWSDFGAVYSSGEPKSQLYERSQGTLGGPWWEKWDTYLDNSPLYHARNIHTPLLIVHGDRDKAVPFSQAVELFNTLRRMGDKQAVMLHYVGEEHDFGAENQRDLIQRELEFFGHFLRGQPAPRWWSDGVSYYEGEASGPAGAGSRP